MVSTSVVWSLVSEQNITFHSANALYHLITEYGSDCLTEHDVVDVVLLYLLSAHVCNFLSSDFIKPDPVHQMI